MRVAMIVLASAAWVALALLTAKTVQPIDLKAGTLGSAVELAAGVSSGPDGGSKGDRINGRKLFLKNNCYICHGGRGGGGMCPSLRDDSPNEDDVQKAVLNGTASGMPSFRRFVTDQDVQDLAAYIKSLRSNQEPTFTHWWEAIPSQ
jgi:mono/diheme cytochrome c family protein